MVENVDLAHEAIETLREKGDRTVTEKASMKR